MSCRKICIDATGIVKKPTGLSRYSVFLLKELLQSPGYSFTVLHQSCLPKEHTLFHFGRNNVKFVPLNGPVIGPQREIAMLTLRKIINSNELFHCLTSYLPAFGLKIPSIVTIHDLKYFLFPTFLNSKLKSIYYNWIIRRGLKNASYIIAVSEATKNDLIQLGVPPEKIFVVYEAPTINPTNRKPLPEALREKKYLLFVGENRPHKNFVNLVKAFHLLQQRLSDKCPFLVIVGSGFEIMRKQNNNHKIIFWGPTDEGTLVSIYQNSLALVYPSLYEGFGLPILEAMLLGIPVITSNCSSMHEIAGNATIFFTPQDPFSIMKAMFIILQDENKRKELRDLGAQRVKQFSWSKSALETISVYKNLL